MFEIGESNCGYPDGSERVMEASMRMPDCPSLMVQIVESMPTIEHQEQMESCELKKASSASQGRQIRSAVLNA